MAERAVVDHFALDRELGILFNHSGDNYSFAASITGDNIEADEAGDDSYSFVSRFTYNPIKTDQTLVHIGTSMAFSEVPEEGVSYGARPGSKIDGGAKLVSNKLIDADEQFIYGIELALIKGAFSLQSEYIHTQVNANYGSNNEDYSAYYLAASWFITGESRSYEVDEGKFDKPVMSRNAWELAARFDHVDLSDNSNGVNKNEGQLDTFTLGLNYYPSKAIRFSLNLIKSSSDLVIADNEDVNIIQLRSQLVF